jgi:hypothetical protein
MKCIITILILLSFYSVQAQKRINILDENVTTNIPTIVFEREDGSIFELNGKSSWTTHKLLPSSQEFKNMVNAKKPLKVEFQTINGDVYTNVNKGNWSKSQRSFEQQGSMNLAANYKKQHKMIEVMYTITNTSLVDINLHSVFGANIFELYKKQEPIGLKRLQLPVNNIPLGEYVLVVRTPQQVSSVRLSIQN